MSQRNLVTLLVGAVLLGACGGDDGDDVGAGANALSFTAALDAPADEPSDVYALWQVSSGSPDYAYIWGSARVKGESFALSLASPPPEDAMNNYGLGVAALVVAPASQPLDEGVQDGDTLFERLTGLSARHAIIYVDHARANEVIEAAAGDASAEDLERLRSHWLFDFPQGYSCAEGRDAEPGETFDSYVPVDCSKVRVHFGDLAGIELVNWT